MSEPKPTLLVVDDKHNMLRLMGKVMGDCMNVLTAEDGTSAVAVLQREAVDVVLCDLRMPDISGIDVLHECKRLRPQAAFVLMTAYASVDTAVEAVKLGAFDYLAKPFEPAAARAVLLQALGRAETQKVQGLPESEVLPGMVGRSAAMLELADLVRRIADSDVTTLLLGETGTGKERMARAVHELSPRASKRFIGLNCAAIPAELLESELFGHAKGAFTGAVGERKGLFEEANGGSLFLDEIGDMRPSLQAKLTRALEERAIRRVGETKERAIDVRLISATHRDLEAMVAEETFRADLWYRLNVALIQIPPLRERRDDVKILARHFMAQQAAHSRSRGSKTLSDAALQALVSYDWPGNVRQVRSAVERAYVVSRGTTIGVSDLPPELTRSGDTLSAGAHWASSTWAEALESARVESGRRYLEAVMKRHQGRVADAALHAGVERESFYRLLKKHGIDASSFRPSLPPKG